MFFIQRPQLFFRVRHPQGLILRCAGPVLLNLLLQYLDEDDTWRRWLPQWLGPVDADTFGYTCGLLLGGTALLKVRPGLEFDGFPTQLRSKFSRCGVEERKFAPQTSTLECLAHIFQRICTRNPMNSGQLKPEVPYRAPLSGGYLQPLHIRFSPTVMKCMVGMIP